MGGKASVTLYNNSNNNQRYAIKVKCSDNRLYRVNPVYTFINPGQTCTFSIHRQCGTAKVDKLIFVFAQVLLL